MPNEVHPFVRGWDAYANGLRRENNPHLAGTVAGRRWEAGFNEHAALDPTGQGRRPAPAAPARAWWVD